uniref:Uncharacterized protein n=1 Tax=Megaselia scalaris TaxID=36166 RepID=T1GC21_MEGSC
MMMMREERRYSVPHHGTNTPLPAPASEDLHAWSIYRQNLNSDFTDSALGSSDKSPLPYGNFKLRDATVHSILTHPRYGPRSPLNSNMYTYLKFGLPRVFPPNEANPQNYANNNGNNGARSRLREASMNGACLLVTTAVTMKQREMCIHIDTVFLISEL